MISIKSLINRILIVANTNTMRKFLLLLFFPLPLLIPFRPLAQHLPYSAYKSYPFPSRLCTAAKGSRIAWTLDQQGKRNVYVAEGPDFTPRMLTRFAVDDGQEITSLSISDDGAWVVFVRGGEHSGNWDNGLTTDPGFGTQPFKVQVASIPFAGGEPKFLSEGDYPLLAPNGKSIAFVKEGQAWSVPVDGAAGAKRLFTTRGTVSSLEWSPDGSSLLFATDRGDHSVIGIYTDSATPLKWVAPSFGYDESPHWSPDGRRIVFVRQPASNGSPDSMLVRRPSGWSIYTADLATNKATLLWKSPKTLRGSVPPTDGGINLHWATGDKIVFLSCQDGWPHLYSIDAGGSGGTVTGSGHPTLLTPGPFMCEHIVLSADKKYLSFSANTGNDPRDIDRRHVAIIDLTQAGAGAAGAMGAAAPMEVLTPGDGLEWTPVLTGDDNTVAFISATAQQCPIPAILSLKGAPPGDASPSNAPLTGDKKIRLLGANLVPTDFPAASLITPQQVILHSTDGLTLHAELFLPPGGASTSTQSNGQASAPGAASRHPAIVYIHGGPPRQMLLGWHYSDYYSNGYSCNQYLASLGFVVLAINYRLGIGYGYDFQSPAHAGVRGAAEYQDIKAAGLWLQQQSFVDAKRIGIYGGSYGGYLTAMGLARDSKLFAAGVDIHGVHDWVINSSMLNAFKNQYEKAPDYDLAVKTAWLSSPVSAISTWTSPVLIIHADDDRNVRFSQSIDLIGRLEKKGVPYETLMIVDDTHHLLRWANAVTVYGAVADFFVRKLHPTP
jgi:dipeptidyl aminopeptidase/acylaminoacyl peptidase